MRVPTCSNLKHTHTRITLNRAIITLLRSCRRFQLSLVSLCMRAQTSAVFQLLHRASATLSAAIASAYPNLRSLAYLLIARLSLDVRWRQWRGLRRRSLPLRSVATLNWVGIWRRIWSWQLQLGAVWGGNEACVHRASCHVFVCVQVFGVTT